MFGRNPLAAVFCLPLAMLLLWQDSSCKSSKSNMNNDSARSENRTANAGANAKANQGGDQTPAGLRGFWGGQGVSTELAERGGEINYDCAHGTITEGIVPDREGNFVAKGFHVRERPGPTREGDDTKGQPATYSGSINGETMTLTVKLSGSNEAIGAFTLTQGKPGRIHKCM